MSINWSVVIPVGMIALGSGLIWGPVVAGSVLIGFGVLMFASYLANE